MTKPTTVSKSVRLETSVLKIIASEAKKECRSTNSKMASILTDHARALKGAK